MHQQSELEQDILCDVILIFLYGRHSGIERVKWLWTDRIDTGRLTDPTGWRYVKYMRGHITEN